MHTVLCGPLPCAIDSIQQPGRRGFSQTLTSSNVCNSFASAELPLWCKEEPMLKPRICPVSTMRFASGSLMLAAIFRLPSDASHDEITEPTAPPSCSMRIGKDRDVSLAEFKPRLEYIFISAAVRSSGS